MVWQWYIHLLTHLSWITSGNEDWGFFQHKVFITLTITANFIIFFLLFEMLKWLGPAKDFSLSRELRKSTPTLRTKKALLTASGGGRRERWQQHCLKGAYLASPNWENKKGSKNVPAKCALQALTLNCWKGTKVPKWKQGLPFFQHLFPQSGKKTHKSELIKVGFVIVVAAPFESCSTAKVYQKIPSSPAISGPSSFQPTLSN